MMPDPAAPATPPAATRSKGALRGRGRRLLILAAVVAVPLLLFAGYVTVVVHWSYSEGERAGYVQKFSRKGWVCKTWEGELAMASIPGTMPELFRFTVRDDAVAAHLNKTMGQRVALSYEQHRGLPTSCFGETEYFVTDVRPVGP
jgi:hypothetical protein